MAERVTILDNLRKLIPPIENGEATHHPIDDTSIEIEAETPTIIPG